MKLPLKVTAFIVVLVAMLATTLSGSVLAGSTSKSLSTNYTLVNLGPTDASVVVSYMKSDGSPWSADAANTNFTIPGNFGSNQVRQYFDTTLSAGQGSVVVSSSQPLGAVVQIQARNQTPTQGAYSGYTAGSNKFFVPLAARYRTTASGVANSQIIIQNADSFDFAVDVFLYQGATQTYQKTTPVLKAGQSYYYDLADESAGNVPAEWLGSAVVQGRNSGKVAVVSNFFTGPDAMQSFNAFPAENIGSKWVAPLFFSRLPNGLSTVIAVQNLNGASIPAGAISLSCTKDTNSFGPSNPTFTVTNPSAIADNASYSFNPVTDFTLFPFTNWGGSCTLDAGTAKVVAIVQMRYVGVANTGAAAYEAIPATGTQGKKVVVPLVAKRLPNGFASVVTIQNMDLTPGGQAASVTLTYTPFFNPAECPLAVCDRNHDGILNASDTITVGPVSIPAAASIQRNHRLPIASPSLPSAEDALPDGWQGSLVATSTTANINGFVQLTYYTPKLGDTFMAHDTFVLP